MQENTLNTYKVWCHVITCWIKTVVSVVFLLHFLVMAIMKNF